VLFDQSGTTRRRGESDGLSRFMRQTPIFEQMLIDDGIMLRKYWF
jgi:polyphosphate kinase 2 (PPK2 family)